MSDIDVTPMLRIPTGGDLLTATHPFETLAGPSKLPISMFSSNFGPLAPPHPTFLCAALGANSRQFTRTLNLELVCN